MSVKDRNEIAFCGITCGNCIKGKGESKKKAKEILDDIKESGLGHWQEYEPKQEFDA